MTYEYDIICIGLGPAGMAVSIMASEMGLKVCAVEKHKVGGECMNVGCIPSKAILRIAQTRHFVNHLAAAGLDDVPAPAIRNPFEKIQAHLRYISDKKTMKMFDKVDLLLGEGAAVFVDPHTVQVGDRTLTAKRIFIATGTKPLVLPVPGIEDVDYLTNETIFDLDAVPESMIVHGGGAIACEMAQAFARLGCQVSLLQRSPHILSRGEPDAAEIVEAAFRDEGIRLYTGQLATRISNDSGQILVETDKGETLRAATLLEALGRKMDYAALNLSAAGIETVASGAIRVNKYLQTSQKHIYAVGDCNGYHLFSHAAMHQGMVALMNSMAFWPFKQDFQKFAVPLTMFTEPQVSHVGLLERELQERGLRYEAVVSKYEDYGAAIAEDIAVGHVKAFVSPTGKIYGADIVGEGSGEMINEWALAIQKGIRIHDIMMLQHSFPTMGFLTKRVAETWAMGKMKSPLLQKICKFMFRL